ncbi:3-methyl-2-oxobutanoate hydroxymethyltransferase [Methylocystis sp. JAN1]|uniref:3-methyl-2-oxobutanoate hydroxymethyltransferase n=1 Tax=Methylocystis sp. JAN1 TaxID=3397211 RepID=UPI003FA2A4E6
MSKADLFLEKKRRGEKIVVVTAYDAPTARIEAEAGVDIILVGDSVGVNILGYAHEREVTLADMAHHIAAVRRGAPEIYIVGDLPYATYDTPEMALASSRALRDAGADCVKFEGAQPGLVAALAAEGYDVCGHLGLESQHQDVKRRQGKTAAAAAKLYDDALAADAAGQKFLVLELVPQELAGRITRAIRSATIGIGAGPETDGQVLVVNDLAGVTTRDFKHNRRYGQLGAALSGAISAYAADVRAGAFPGPEHSFHMVDDERAAFETWLRGRAGFTPGRA